MQALMFKEPHVSTPADQQEHSLSSTLNAMPDLMFELDADGRHYDFRALRTDLLVAPPENLLGRTVNEVMPAEAAEAVMLALRETHAKGYSNGTQIHLPTPLGERWFEVSMARKEQINGEEPRFIALSRDITERKEQQLKIEKLAYTDTLTSLPNRLLLEERLRMALRSGQRTGLYTAILFMDLDNFKALNDSRGHAVGDRLLQQFADRLRSSVRAQDLVARWGGDVFVVVIEAIGQDRAQTEAQARLICKQIIEKMTQPFNVDDNLCQCAVSIGVKLSNQDPGSIDQLIKHADMAMYDAKKNQGSHYRIYTEA